MSQKDSTQDEQFVTDDFDFRDERALVELYDDLQDANVDWTVSIESDDLSGEESEALQKAVMHTIGNFRGIVGRDKFISSGVYWSLVNDYAEEFIKSTEEGTDLDDVALLREIVMPKQMARYYESDPAACFWTLMHSRHNGEGWAQDFADEYFGYDNAQDFAEWLENEKGWNRVLSHMATAACMQDVAQELRHEDYDLDLGDFEYLNDR